MRGIKAKRLRGAAGYKPSRDRTAYEPQQVRNRLFQTPGGALEQFKITLPIRVFKRSPRQIYRLLKRLERTVGLDKVYSGLLNDHLNGVKA